MLAAASKLFVERGYAATSMQTIATEAKVAVQTLYFTFATKRAILSELVDQEVAGDDGPVPTLDRPWVAEALAAEPADMLRRLALEATRINARVAPIMDVVRSATGLDPDIDDLWQANVSQRHAVVTVFAGALVAKGRLRNGITAGQAADIMLAVLSPEVYKLLTDERGWTQQALAAWTADSLVHQFLPD
jgi:AcrR family transcriptional regulator